MEDLAALMTICVDLMKIPFTIWGFTLSWWDILMWSLIAGIIVALLVVFFCD